MRRMKHRLIMTCGALVAWLAAPLSSLAQEEEREMLDARLEGYPSIVTLEASSALTWILFIVLALLALGGLFKDAKRTHLD